MGKRNRNCLSDPDTTFSPDQAFLISNFPISLDLFPSTQAFKFPSVDYELQRKLKRRLAKLLKYLSEEERQLVRKYYTNRKSQTEMAVDLPYSQATVSWRLKRIIRRLKCFHKMPPGFDNPESLFSKTASILTPEQIEICVTFIHNFGVQTETARVLGIHYQGYIRHHVLVSIEILKKRNYTAGADLLQYLFKNSMALRPISSGASMHPDSIWAKYYTIKDQLSQEEKRFIIQMFRGCTPKALSKRFHISPDQAASLAEEMKEKIHLLSVLSEYDR